MVRTVIRKFLLALLALVPCLGHAASGDILIATIIGYPNVAGAGTSDGYTLMESRANVVTIWCKVDGGSETNPTFTSTASADASIMARITRYQGGTCTEHVGGNAYTPSGGDIDVAALTITEDDTLIVALGGTIYRLGGNGSVANGISGFTEDTDSEFNPSPNAPLGLISAHLIQTTATNISSSTPGFDMASTSGDAYSAITSLSADTTWVQGDSGAICTDDTGFVNEAASATCALPAEFVTNEFDVDPTVSSKDSLTITLGGSVDGSATVDAVACPLDQTNPMASQIAAHDCTGDVDAEAFATGTWSGSDSFTLTLAASFVPGSTPFPCYLIAATDGTNVVDVGDICLDDPTLLEGSFPYQYINEPTGFTSIGSGSAVEDLNTAHAGTHTGSNNASGLTDSAALTEASWYPDDLVGLTISNTTDGSSCAITANGKDTVTCTLTGGTDNDWDTGDAYVIEAPIATGDIAMCPSYVIPGGATMGFTMTAAGFVSYANGDANKQYATCYFYDRSAEDWSAVILDWDNNNNAPTCSAEYVSSIIYDVAYSLDLDTSLTSDDDGDALISELITGSLNSGLALNGATNVISGTPDTLDENQTFTIEMTDVSLATCEQDFDLTVVLSLTGGASNTKGVSLSRMTIGF